MIPKEEVHEYWEKRAQESGKAAVGFDGKNIKKQDQNYKIKTDFVLPKIRTAVPTLDYGCGIGRWAKYFYGTYVGCDITKSLLQIALAQNPDKKFVHLSNPYLKIGPLFNYIQNIEQVLTSTVLQHCDDSLVIKIISSFAEFIPLLATLIFYEINNEKNKPHVTARDTNYYKSLIEVSNLQMKGSKSYTHIVHNETHTLSIFKVGLKHNEG